MNSVTLTGYLVANIEANEKGFVNFLLIVPRSASPGGTPRTDAIPCSCSGSEAAFAKAHLKKGSNIKVTGSIRVYGKEWCVNVSRYLLEHDKRAIL